MKATVIRQKVYESEMDRDHGGGQTIKRLVVEKAGNLAITIYNDEVHAFPNFDMKDAEVIGEVEVPDELVDKALRFAKAKTEFNDLKDKFEALMKR